MRGHPLPRWHRRCTTLARAVTASLLPSRHPIGVAPSPLARSPCPRGIGFAHALRSRGDPCPLGIGFAPPHVPSWRGGANSASLRHSLATRGAGACPALRVLMGLSSLVATCVAYFPCTRRVWEIRFRHLPPSPDPATCIVQHLYGNENVTNALLRDLRAELLRACGLWALSPARGTTVRLLLRSYRAARPRYAHRAPPRPPRGDRAKCERLVNIGCALPVGTT